MKIDLVDGTVLDTDSLGDHEAEIWEKMIEVRDWAKARGISMWLFTCDRNGRTGYQQLTIPPKFLSHDAAFKHQVDRMGNAISEVTKGKYKLVAVDEETQ